MKRINKTIALASVMLTATLGFTSCEKDNINDEVNEVKALTAAPTLVGQVKGNLLMSDDQVHDIDSYGMLVPSFTPADLMKAGFQYSDLLDVKIGDNIELHNVPFVTGFNEVGVLETCFCDYNAQGTMYGFGLLHGNFSERIGGKIGDRIEITLAKRQGYKDTWEIMKSIYYPNRDLYDSDEIFANFREVNTTGMGKGILYRSSNPLNPKDNAVRYAYVDRLAEAAGINTEIDLADTPQKVQNYRAMAGFESTYCPALYDADKVITLGLTADTYSTTFMNKLGDGLRFMINNQPPYLVHCNEGKDRCGFVIILLESLAGATYQEVADDYMQTLINFYKIEKGDTSYNLRKTLSVDRLVWLLENIDAVDDYTNITWQGKDPSKVNLQEAARSYVLKCGLTPQECDMLQQKLQGK